MTANPPPPDPSYGERALYQEAMRAYPGSVAFARWLCDTYPWGGVDLPTARAEYLAPHLASHRHYPATRCDPAWHDDRETCVLCLLPTSPPDCRGWLAIGGGAHPVHIGCAGRIERAQDRAEHRNGGGGGDR